MARPREFDMEAALDAAMRLFWLKGYEGASLDELLTTMKIGRGSLYKAFGSKRALYLRTLARYDDVVVGHAVQGLRGGGADAGVVRIRALLYSVASSAERGEDPPGCFLCNASVDQAPLDPDVALSVSASLARLDRAFAAALAERPGAAKGEGENDAAGQRLTADYIGLRVLARCGRAPDALRRLADQVVEGL